MSDIILRSLRIIFGIGCGLVVGMFSPHAKQGGVSQTKASEVALPQPSFVKSEHVSPSMTDEIKRIIRQSQVDAEQRIATLLSFLPQDVDGAIKVALALPESQQQLGWDKVIQAVGPQGMKDLCERLLRVKDSKLATTALATALGGWLVSDYGQCARWINNAPAELDNGTLFRAAAKSPQGAQLLASLSSGAAPQFKGVNTVKSIARCYAKFDHAKAMEWTNQIVGRLKREAAQKEIR